MRVQLPTVKDSSNELGYGVGLAARFIVESGALDRPFVLLDIGVRGGVHPRWLALEPALEVYGFDAIAEVPTPNDRHHYFKLALGERDGECTFYVPENLYEARVSAEGRCKVPIAKLDTLWARGVVPPADFIKIDCEGYEPEILAGASEYLRASSLSGADIESHFHVATSLPYSHFAAVNTVFIEQRLRVADLTLQRAQEADQPWNGTCNVLFARHLLEESRDDELSANAILKTIAIFDIYGLIGPAVALTRRFQAIIAARIDISSLERKLILSPKIGTLERHLPHLGLGLWTRAKKLLTQ